MSSATVQNSTARSFPWPWILLGVFLGVALMGLALLIPGTRARLAGSAAPAGGEEHGHGHEGHDHGGDLNSIDVSPQAQKNIGLTTAPVQLTTFERTVSIPGMVVERPGRSKAFVVSPLTGVVTRMNVVQGEAVEPGQPLFDVRVTHEEMVQAQADFLRSTEELDVLMREVARLQSVSNDGIVAGKELLARQYEQKKLEAVLRAARQALVLHGLTEQQVDTIVNTRTLLSTLTVVAPPPSGGEEGAKAKPVYQVQELRVELGQHVNAGDPLAVLTEHSELFVEGSAFEQDVAEVTRAAQESWPLTAIVDSKTGTAQKLTGLKILYLEGKVDSATRMFHFYVALPNELVRDSKENGRRFAYWRFKPGQRLQLHVPVERWEKRLVLPLDAIAQDGVETFVFQPNGGKFTKRPVHVEYRDTQSAVLANDGSLFPGDVVATSAGHQLLLALKNKAGGGVDPHAGHQH